MDKETAKKMAQQLYRHYHGKMLAEVSYHGRVVTIPDPLRRQPLSVRLSFKKAAYSCFGVGARPRDWIEAQFDKFEEYRAFVNKRIIPQPAQLSGLNAQVRYVQWKGERTQEEHRDRKHDKTIKGKFTIDERNLKALCRTMRLPESEVLSTKPDMFTIPFLKRKGVYDLVAERRDEIIEGVS